MIFDRTKGRTDNILSIDVDAHLEKLTTHTYRSPAHYPVELVRSALQRGATRVSVEINRKKIEIQDNGSGIDAARILKLKMLMESGVPIENKEQAIIELQHPEGIGLLSIFSPSPAQIRLHNTTSSHEQLLSFKNESLREFTSESINQEPSHIDTGTRLTLYRKSPHLELEQRTLKEYCRGVTVDIWLNHELISKKSVIKNAMASLILDSPILAEKGEVGIPKRGDVCHIWILDQGIPVSRKIIAPWRGFIFDAALETNSDITGKFLDGLLRDIYRLYQYLIEKYPTLPCEYQHRVEELIFKHHRLSNDASLVEDLPAFKSNDSPHPLTLSQLRTRARTIILYAIPLEIDLNQYDTSNKMVLQLNQQQIDYLINHSDIPVQFLNPSRPHSTLTRWIYELIEKWERIPHLIPLLKIKRIPDKHLTPEELQFIRLLSRHLKSLPPDQSKPFTGGGITFIEGKGLVPFSLQKQKSRDRSAITHILIHRKHPLIKKAVETINRHPENIEYVGALFQ